MLSHNNEIYSLVLRRGFLIQCAILARYFQTKKTLLGLPTKCIFSAINSSSIYYTIFICPDIKFGFLLNKCNISHKYASNFTFIFGTEFITSTFTCDEFDFKNKRKVGSTFMTYKLHLFNKKQNFISVQIKIVL